MPAPSAPAVSIIIPALNEETSLGKTLEALEQLPGSAEVIVVDGGSEDGTRDMVRRSSARLLTAPRGRGSQLHAGASAAHGKLLWFLHADTRPPRQALRDIQDILDCPAVVGGNFNVDFDGDTRAARFLTRLYAILRRFGLCYGDSAIFVRADIYFEVGGFKPYPIFEDLDLIRRLKKRGRIAESKTRVITSSRRFEGRSFFLTFARWSILQVFYWCGFPPERLGRMYAPIRSANTRHRRNREIARVSAQRMPQFPPEQPEKGGSDQ